MQIIGQPITSFVLPLKFLARAITITLFVTIYLISVPERNRKRNL